jgi:hypothetical protein
VRLSRPRLVLRAALLLLAGGLVALRAVEDGRRAAAAGLEPGLAIFHSRLALIEWGLSGLAWLTALAALLSLRRPARRHLLHLGAARPGDGPVPFGAAGPGFGPATGPDATRTRAPAPGSNPSQEPP